VNNCSSETMYKNNKYNYNLRHISLTESIYISSTTLTSTRYDDSRQ
jgi:hypothetical protein